jgi:Domain of unknown function (DUF4349)
MESHRDTLLTAELRTMRPTPQPEFVAELDARAAAGFPRKDRGGSARGRIASWFERRPRRRLPALAGAAAIVAIAVATAVVAISEDDSASPVQDKSGGLLSYTSPAGAGDEAMATEGASRSAPVHPFASGPYAAAAARRDVERSARIVLATEVSEVRAAAARVYETVRSYDGIVIRSSVRDGSAGQAGAVFDLLIPSGKLGAALAVFSEIADVRSRSDSTLDVTAPTIGLEERLHDARETVEELLAQRAGAETSAEREAIEAALRAERRRVASLRSRLVALQRRTHFSRVSLRIETGAAATAGDSGDRWGVDDALDEAGRILTIAAGVTLIGLAILAPLALIGLLAWLANRAWVRSRRERALGGAEEG